ncbi:Hypothetical predicted protein [Pelobates cultripes]|uniref:Uncharacterized protein n=1 Tax=Pelobates cultripes TaxID=61616 RepID=A0AAD1RGC5_PELCU|nr:Hypothetical predicted protein [Pelobates cultripes]
MAAEYSPRQRLQPAIPKQRPDSSTDLTRRIDELFAKFWEKLQLRAQSAQTSRKTPKRAGERGHVQPTARGAPLGTALDHSPPRTLHSPIQPSKDSIQTKGNPGIQPHRQPNRKAVNQRRLEGGKTYQGSPRRRRSVKPNPTATTTSLTRTGSSQCPRRPTKIPTGNTRYSQGEPEPSTEQLTARGEHNHPQRGIG